MEKLNRENLGFPKALEALRDGYSIARKEWHPRQFLFYVDVAMAPSKFGELHIEPFICVRTEECRFVPWLCSQEDALANDWYVIIGSKIEDDEEND